MRKLKMQELGRMTVEEFQAASKSDIRLVLDNVRSAHNVGAAFRTADAFRVEHLLLGGICATPPHKDITKTALGASDSVNWTRAEKLVPTLKEWKKDGWKIIAVEQTDGSTALKDFSFDNCEKVALIFGHEVKGVSDEVLEICDEAVVIEQFGTKHSLNISVSVGIVLWQFMRGLSRS